MLRHRVVEAMTADRPVLRPYQVADLNRIEAEFALGTERVLHQSPTASGKTVLFAEIIMRADDDGARVLVLGHRDEIVQQVCRALRKLNIRHGIIAPEYPETSHPVQVASVMSLVRRLDRLAPPDLIVIDEAHHAVAATWTKILDHWPNAWVLGVTATPRRLDGKPLDDIFDKLIVGPSIASLIDDGYLAPVTVFTPPNSPDLTKVQIRAGDYAVDQLSRIMSGGMIISGAVDEYERLCPGAPAIVFAVDIAHSERVAATFQRRRWRAAHLDGHTPRDERRRLIAALGDGTIDVICNCGLISEGLDVPGVVAAVLLRPTKSLALYLQMVGRALRPAPGKDQAFVLDHAGNVYRHGLPTARRRWSLHGKQQDDSAVERLFRCPECGAINDRHDEACVNCGAPLHERRAPRVEVAGRRLAEAIETPVDDDDIADMTYRTRSMGRRPGRQFLLDRLERIARARDFKPGWVWYHRNKRLVDVLRDVEQWRQNQLATGA